VIIVDTHAWLWWVNGDATLSAAARRTIDRAEEIGISSISAMEVAALVQRERVELEIGARQWVAKALAYERVREVPLTADVAVEAGSFGADFVGDPADRIIYATAIVSGAKLVTRDRFLRSYDPARTVW
jgi:PIN domain nuclease of toxin-antitoxin system